MLIAGGAHPLLVRERMRHSSIRVTMDRYGHLFPALGDEATQALDATLRSHPGPGGRGMKKAQALRPGPFLGGGDGSRTHDLYVANVAL